MPISSSRYFNSPELASAASNLAGLFEPPSGSDAAGWAAANAKNAEAKRLAALYDYRNAPDFDQEQFDRMGEAAGAWTPNQGYGMTRRSQDIGAQTQRYGYDTTAATLRANNAADNTRALETNRLSELGNLFGPIAQDATRPAIPSDIASQFGVGHGLVAEHGKDSPLSETQVKAAIFGELTPEMQKAITFGSTPIESIVTPAGPRNVLRTDAIGQTPYEKPTAAGTTMTLPDGTVVSVGGDKGLTADQSRLANFSTTAEAMLGPLDKMGAELTDLTGGLAAQVPGGMGNYMQSEGYQQATILAERFVQSVLRNESGAATPNEEITKYNATFIPRAGDKPGTIRLKSWLRKVAAEAMDTGLGKQARLAKIDAAAAAGPPPEFMPDTAAALAKQPNTPADAAAPAAVVAPPAATASTIPDGTVIQNDAGEKMIRKNGKWEPVSG
jgi:hypothetical protein